MYIVSTKTMGEARHYQRVIDDVLPVSEFMPDGEPSFDEWSSYDKMVAAFFKGLCFNSYSRQLK